MTELVTTREPNACYAGGTEGCSPRLPHKFALHGLSKCLKKTCLESPEGHLSDNRELGQSGVCKMATSHQGGGLSSTIS